MGLPNAPTDIANMALDVIGQAPVSCIDPPSNTVEALCSRWYDPARQAALRMLPWNFAKERYKCPRMTAVTPAFDFTDAYQLPNDFIRLLSVDGESEIEQNRDYDLTDNLILMNKDTADSINLRYVKDVKDISMWKSDFRLLVVYFLALHLAFPITKKKAVVEMCEGFLRSYMPDASSVDGQEVPPRRIQKSVYLAARMQGGLGDDPTRLYLP